MSISSHNWHPLLPTASAMAMIRHILLASLSVLAVSAFTPSTLSAYNLGLSLRSRSTSLRPSTGRIVMKSGGSCPISFFSKLGGDGEKDKPKVSLFSKSAGGDGEKEKTKDVPSMQQTYMQGPMTTGSHGPLSETELAEAKAELDAILAKGFRAPVRSFMDDPKTKWRFGEAPNYDLANLLFLKGKTKNHAEGSLEQIVEDLVKTWEMEASHKTDVNQWETITEDWTIGANGWKMFGKEESASVGNYNTLSWGVDKEVWDTSMSWDETHDVMHEAFPAFPWEVLEVFSGPPRVMFSWRHWAHFTGEYKGNKGQGQLVEMYGMGLAEVSEDLKLKTVEIFYKPEEFFAVLEGKKEASEIAGGKSLVGPGCPFIK